MPLYFFKVSLNKAGDDPRNGLDLPDINAAWEEATSTCGEMIKELDGSLETGSEWAIEIQDEFRNLLRSLTVSAKTHRR